MIFISFLVGFALLGPSQGHKIKAVNQSNSLSKLAGGGTSLGTLNAKVPGGPAVCEPPSCREVDEN